MPPKCGYCPCDNCELDPVYVALIANGRPTPTPFKCKNCSCSQKPKH